MTIPYSRVVNVSLSRTDAFPSRRGFGTALFLTSVAKANKVDANHRTKAYSSMDEVAADWTTSDPFYKAALAAFSQNPRPTRVKVGFVDTSDSDFDADVLMAEIDAIHDVDQDWYWLTPEAALRDSVDTQGILDWTEAHRKFAVIASNDTDTQNPAVTTSIAGENKGNFERSAIFYHTNAALYPDFALAATLGTYNFDDADSAYTAKFKRLESIPPIDVGSAAVTAITGFVEGVGQSTAAGHIANTMIDIGGRSFVVEGSTLTPNVFIDEVHASDWIVTRTEEAILGILLNNKRVPFTDVGMEMLASGVRETMNVARRAGIIAEDRDPATGDYAPAVTITVPSVFDVPEAQRKARIAPAISVRFRYAGAVHYSVINYTMTF